MMTDPYNYVEVWKAAIMWNGEEYVRYMPHRGYDDYSFLYDFKREFYKYVMLEIGYPSERDVFIYSAFSHEELVDNRKREEMFDTAKLLCEIPHYPIGGGELPYKNRYVKDDVVNWLKGNSHLWLNIEKVDFYDVPVDEQKRIRMIVEEEEAIQRYLNRGGEL